MPTFPQPGRPPGLRVTGERTLIAQLVAWVESTRGQSLDLPPELAPLLDSHTSLPPQAGGYLRMGAGAHRVGAAIQRIQAQAALAGAIDQWSRIAPALRSPVAEHLHCNFRGQTRLEDASTWLRTSTIPLPADLAARLGLPAGTTWGTACQALHVGEPVAV